MCGSLLLYLCLSFISRVNVTFDKTKQPGLSISSRIKQFLVDNVMYRGVGSIIFNRPVFRVICV